METQMDRWHFSVIPITKRIQQVDLRSDLITFLEIDTLPEHFAHLEESFRLNDGRLFVFGGGKNGYDYSKRSYLINPSTKEWVKLADLKIPTETKITPVQVNEHLYIIGGRLNSKIKGHIKYSLNENKWEVINCFFNISGYVHALNVNNNILIIGEHTGGIVVYDTSQDKYSKVFEHFPWSFLLFKLENGDIFYLSNSFIFKSSEYDFTQWGQIGRFDIVLPKTINNQPYQYREIVYFHIHHDEFLCFDLKKLKLSYLQLNFI